MYYLNVSDHHAALARAALNGNRKLLTGATPRKPVCGADREVVGERQEYPILPAAGWTVLTPVYDFLCSAVGLGKRFKRWLIELANVEPHDRVLFQNSAECLCRFSIVMIEEPAEPFSTGDPT